MPTEIGAMALGFLATSHFWKFRALFFDGRIPARFLWLLMGLSMVWNAIVWNSGEGLRSIVIMRDAAILFAF